MIALKAIHQRTMAMEQNIKADTSNAGIATVSRVGTTTIGKTRTIIARVAITIAKAGISSVTPATVSPLTARLPANNLTGKLTHSLPKDKDSIREDTTTAITIAKAHMAATTAKVDTAAITARALTATTTAKVGTAIVKAHMATTTAKADTITETPTTDTITAVKADTIVPEDSLEKARVSRLVRKQWNMNWRFPIPMNRYA